MKYVITRNGRIIDRGFETFQQAWNFANDEVKGLESHKRSSTVYTPEFAVQVDAQDVREHNQLWNEMKTHTMVTRP